LAALKGIEIVAFECEMETNLANFFPRLR